MRWIPIPMAVSAVVVAVNLGSCGRVCSRAEPRALPECPCQPGEYGETDGASATSGAAVADDGCFRAAPRCECGVPPDDGEASSDTDTDTDTTDTTDTDAPVCDVDTPVTLYLSADDSNSMSSPVQARAAVLADWQGISQVPIRSWEFFNYYDFGYPPAAPGEVALSLEMERKDDGEYALQIGVRSEVITRTTRPPLSVTLVLDTSGSMEGEPLELLQEVCRAVIGSLRAGDRASVVKWNSEQAVVVDGLVVAGADDPQLHAAIDGLVSDGSTDLAAGLAAGYALAAKYAVKGEVSRVLLISDGGANTGITDIDLIAAHAGAEDEEGIYMVGVGVGSATTYRDELMDRVTDAGKGASVFIPDKAEAWKIFGARFISTLMVAARDVQIELQMPPGFAIKRFSGEEYSSDPAEVEPQHLAPNDAMIFHQRVETCAPELVQGSDSVTVTARYFDAITFAPREVSVTRTFDALIDAASPGLRKGEAMLAYSDALTAARLGGGDLEAKIAAASEAIAAAQELLADDADLAEIAAVLANL